MDKKLITIFMALTFIITSAGFVSADTNAWGVKLPDDALPASQQIIKLPCPEQKHFDISADLYQANTNCGATWINEPLLTRDQNDKVIPGVAERWDRKGDTWTFYLRKAKWSDGSPLTAHDFVYAFRRHANPATGSGWTWFYKPILNYRAISKGEMKPEELGMRAIDDYTLEVKTQGEILYLDQLLAFVTCVPAPRKVIEKYPDTWAVDADKLLTNGPWKLSSYKPGREVILVPNEHYVGDQKPYIEKFILYPHAKQASSFNQYQAGEVDGLHSDHGTSPLLTQEYIYVNKHKTLSKELYFSPKFATRYIFYNATKKPWNDVRVREAFTRAIDRVSIVKVVFAGLGTPSYGMLPPGFPGYKKGANNQYQSYDPEKARKLLAEAGYPGGKGFPEATLWYKTGNKARVNVVEIVQQMLKKNLGISIKLQPAESKYYNSSLAEKKIDFGFHTWDADYNDASNFLNLWDPTKGRHQYWDNADYNALVRKAETWPDPVERDAMYTKADTILSKDHGASFIYHTGKFQMWKPHVKGILKNAYGYQNVNYWWTGFSTIYLAKP